jgi:hypothetical protein
VVIDSVVTIQRALEVSEIGNALKSLVLDPKFVTGTDAPLICALSARQIFPVSAVFLLAKVPSQRWNPSVVISSSNWLWQRLSKRPSVVVVWHSVFGGNGLGIASTSEQHTILGNSSFLMPHGQRKGSPKVGDQWGQRLIHRTPHSCPLF